MLYSINVTFLILAFLPGKTLALADFEDNDIVSISEFMDGITNCEMQIVYDNTQRIAVKPRDLRPITILHFLGRVSQRSGSFGGQLVRDISRIRD